MNANDRFVELTITDQRGPIHVAGAFDLATSDQGMTPRRLPAWTSSQLPAAMDFVVATSSGCRIRLRSDATELRVRVKATHFHLSHEAPADAVIDVVCDGRVVGRHAIVDGDLITLDLRTGAAPVRTKGTETDIAIGGLEPVMKDIEVWLPHRSSVEIRSVEVPAVARCLRPASGDPRWIHHGSSISQCREASAPTRTWPAAVALRHRLDLINLGFGGQCHLDQFVARTIAEARADLISLELGINVVTSDSMRARVLESAVHGFLDTVRNGHPDVPVLVISPIACPIIEHDPGPTALGPDGGFVSTTGELPPGHPARLGHLTLTEVRDIIHRVVAMRQEHGDERLGLIDGRDLLGFDDADLLTDAIHPNDEGYLRMAERFSAIAFSRGGSFVDHAS